MCGSQIAALVDELARAELATCDRVALARLVAKAQKAHSWLDAFDARAAQRVAKLAQADAGDRQAAVLGGGGRRSGREAAAVERQAKALELLPQLGEALAAGEVSAGHVDAVARTVADLDDAGRERLRELDAAVTDAAIGASSVEAFEKETRELSRLLSPDDGLDRARRRRRQRSLRRWTDRQTGM